MKKFYGVYLAYSKYEILSDEQCLDPNIPKYPPQLARIRIYDNLGDQLNAYGNTMCPASQLFEADTKEEIDEKIKNFEKNFQDEFWLQENIYPFV